MAAPDPFGDLALDPFADLAMEEGSPSLPPSAPTDPVSMLAAPGHALAGALRDAGLTVAPTSKPRKTLAEMQFRPDPTGLDALDELLHPMPGNAAPAVSLDEAYRRESAHAFDAVRERAQVRDLTRERATEATAEERQAEVLRGMAAQLPADTYPRREKEASAQRHDAAAAELRADIGRDAARARGGLEEGVVADLGAAAKGVGHVLEVAGRPAEALGAAVAAGLSPDILDRDPWTEAKKALAGKKGALGWGTAMAELDRRGLSPFSLISDVIHHDPDEKAEQRAERHEITNAIGAAVFGSVLDPTMIGKIAKVGALTRGGRAAQTIAEGKRLAELRGVAASLPPKQALEAAERLAEGDRAFAAGSVAEQFRKGQRALIQVGGYAMPGTRSLGAWLGGKLDWISKGIREGQVRMTHGDKVWNLSEGVRDAARAFRITSMLPEAEQDAMLMRWFTVQEQRAMADRVGREWVADARQLDSERAAFDRQLGKASTSREQQERLIGVFEKGPQLELDARVARALEGGQLTEGEGKYLLRIKDKFDNLLSREQAAGVGVARLSNEELTYLAHVMTPEAMAELGKTERVADFWGRLKAQPGFAKERSLDIGALEANAAAKQLGLKADLFTTDMPTIAAARELASIRATTPRELTQRITQRFADASGALPPEVARFVSEVEKASTPEVKGALRQVWDGYTKWWKTWSLSPRPSFHARNLAGNIWNNALAGVWDPRDYALAMTALTSKGALGKAVPLANGERVTLGSLVDEARQVGADRTEFGGSLDRMREQVEKELGRRAAEKAGSVGGKAVEWAQKYVPMLSADEATNVWLKAGMATGDFIERHARLAHYIAKRRAGLSAEQAALSVKRYLFDYTDLTAAERKLRDIGMPFYGWMRNNAALQVTKFIEQPWKFSTVKRGIEALEDREAPPYELYPEWMQSAGVVRRGKATPGGIARAYTLSGYWPGWDLSRLGEGDVLSGLHPAAGLATGLWTGVDTFSGRRISGLRSEAPGVEGRRQAIFGGDLPSGAAFGVRKLLPVFAQEVDRSNPGSVFGRSSKAVNEEGVRVDAAGEAPTLNLLRPFGVRTAEARDRTDLPWQDRLAQYLFGLRPYGVDLSREARSRILADEKSQQEQTRLLKDEWAAKNFQRAADHDATMRALARRRQDTARAYLEAGIPLYSER